jgi:hypothetical protein
MNTMPAPMLPPDIDLRKYDNFPLEFRRLFASDTWVLGTPEQRVACLYLWTESWHQVPAGSLPNNARMLSELSRTGQRWKRLAPHCMRGWTLCTDDRWYHPVVVQKAMEAWDKLVVSRAKGLAGAAKRYGPGGSPATLELSLGHSSEVKVSEVKGTGSTPPTPFILPGWVPKETWAAFEEMRRAIKKPMTDRARDLVVAALARMSGPAGQQAQAILEQSIRNNWQDVYPLKTNTAQGAGRQAQMEAGNRGVVERFVNGGKP